MLQNTINTESSGNSSGFLFGGAFKQIHMILNKSATQPSLLVKNAPQFISYVKNIDQLATTIFDFIQVAKQFNDKRIYHPSLAQEFSPNSLQTNSNLQIIRSCKTKRPAVSAISISRRFKSIHSQVDLLLQEEGSMLISFQKSVRWGCCLPESLKLLDRLEELLTGDKPPRQIFIEVAQKLFLEFFHIEHYNQVLVLFQQLCSDLQKDKSNINILEDFRKKIVRRIPQMNEWPQFLSAIQEEIKIYQENASAENSQMSLSTLIISNQYLSQLEKGTVHFDESNIEHISEFEKSFLEGPSSYISLSDSARKEQAILHYLKVCQQEAIVNAIHQSKLEFILKPVEKKSCNEKQERSFSYRVTKGEDIFSKRHSRKQFGENVGYKLLWKMGKKQLIYCFLYCLVKACEEIQSLGIHYVDFKLDNLVKFGNKFMLIDLDHAYPIPSNQSQRFNNMRKMIRLILVNALTASYDQHLWEEKWIFRERESQFNEIREKFIQDIKNFQKTEVSLSIKSSNMEKVEKIFQKHEMQCIELLKESWRKSHGKQLKQCLQKLFDPMYQEIYDPIMDKYERNCIKTAFQASYPNDIVGNKSHINFIDGLKHAFKTKSPNPQKIDDCVLEELVMKTQNSRFTLPLSKEQILKANKPRYIFAFLESLTKKISSLIKHRKIDKNLSFSSFKLVGQAFEYIQHSEVKNKQFWKPKTEEEVRLQNIQQYKDITKNLLCFDKHPISAKFKEEFRLEILERVGKLGVSENFNSEELRYFLQKVYHKYKRNSTELSYLKTLTESANLKKEW